MNKGLEERFIKNKRFLNPGFLLIILKEEKIN
jgi:hypothetical protein